MELYGMESVGQFDSRLASKAYDDAMVRQVHANMVDADGTSAMQLATAGASERGTIIIIHIMGTGTMAAASRMAASRMARGTATAEVS